MYRNRNRNRYVYIFLHLISWPYKVLRAHLVYSQPQSWDRSFSKEPEFLYWWMVLETETWVLAELTATANVSYRSSQLIGQRNICMCVTSGRLLSINISVYNHPYLYETQQELIPLFPNLIHPIGIFPASCLCLPVNPAPAVRHLAPTIIHPST